MVLKTSKGFSIELREFHLYLKFILKIYFYKENLVL